MAIKLPKFLTNPGAQLFGSGYNPERDVSKQFIQQRGNLAGTYQNRLAQSSANVQRFDPMYQAALRTRLNYLQAQPYASEQDALSLARAATANTAQYGASRANLARMLANRGVGGGIEAGALANLEGMRMGNLAQAQNQIALNRIAARNAAQQEALGLLGGARSMYSGEEMGNVGALSDLYGGQASAYGGLAAQRDAENQRRQAAMGQLIGGVAGLYGGGGVTRMANPVNYGGQMVDTGTTFNEFGIPVGTGTINAMQSQPQTRRSGLLSRLLGMRF